MVLGNDDDDASEFSTIAVFDHTAISQFVGREGVVALVFERGIRFTGQRCVPSVHNLNPLKGLCAH